MSTSRHAARGSSAAPPSTSAASARASRPSARSNRCAPPGPSCPGRSSISAATSPSQARRRAAGSLHHLIDPGTGAPAARGPLAVTVLARDAATAEAHATALGITPVEDARGYLEARPLLAALVVPRTGAPFVVGHLPLRGAAAA
jgi:hypothetical protein